MLELSFCMLKNNSFKRTKFCTSLTFIKFIFFCHSKKNTWKQKDIFNFGNGKAVDSFFLKCCFFLRRSSISINNSRAANMMKILPTDKACYGMNDLLARSNRNYGVVVVYFSI